MKRSMRVASLVLDTRLYPRTTIDRHHVDRLAEAIRAGVDLTEHSPIVVEESSLRIVDGAHRREAMIRVQGDDATGEVDLRIYADDAALFVDAVSLNVVHGLRISRLDEAHCISVALDLGVPPDQLAEVLAITRTKYEQHRATRFATGPNGGEVLLKSHNKHLAGLRLSEQQVRGNMRSNGRPLRFHVDQVINALETGIADLGDSGLLDRLNHLAELVEQFRGVSR